MIHVDDYGNENKTEHNIGWPYIPDHPYRILIVCGSGSEKTNALLILINNQTDIHKIYLYAKDPKVFMEYSNDMQDVYKNIDDYNTGKKRKILIVFDEIIADMINNKILYL